LQYWKPDADNEFAGDMMPYWDGETFHLFYLLDRDHHGTHLSFFASEESARLENLRIAPIL